MAGDSPQPTDKELIAAINAGDDEAFAALYFRYRDWVTRLARRFAGNAEDALDVLQETFGYLLRKFPGFELTAAMTTFLYPVVRNLSLEARRKRLRFGGGEQGGVEEITAADVPAGERQRDELASALGSLPDACREVLLMRYVDDMGLAEIAAALEIPIGTVKSRLHNSLESLRNDRRAREFFGSDG